VARQEKKNRIETGASSGGLNDAFASGLSGLDTSSLPEGKETPPAEPDPSPSKRGRVLLRREKAHRGGKVVIVVHDFESSISDAEIEDLGRRLRRQCGSGGTVHGREIEIQGEQAAKIRQFLQTEGFRVAGV